MPDFHVRRCNRCGLEKSVSDLVPSKKYAGGYMPCCKPCRNEYWRDRRSKNPEVAKRHVAAVLRSKMLHKYGMSSQDYDRMVAAQGGKCALCGTTETGRGTRFRSWNVDHCHKSGVVRGLLCNSCNAGLGHYEKLVDQFGHVRLGEYLNVPHSQQSPSPS